MRFKSQGLIVWAFLILAVMTLGWAIYRMPWWMFFAWVGWFIWLVIEGEYWEA